MISKVQKIKDFEILKKEILDFYSEFANGANQIMCQTKIENSYDCFTGVGRIDELEETNEQAYCFIHPKLKGTYLEKIIKQNNACRSRILKLNPRSCYSVHKDPSLRIQIPIVTTDEAWMIWPYDNTCINLHEGYLYLVDTTKDHTFINGHGSIERIHLVMCTS